MASALKPSLRWGILGTARAATGRMLPAFALSTLATPFAIASRDLAKAQSAAKEFLIPRSYGSYEELLADPEVDAIYNPLPNHLHAYWTTLAARAGKHVLCEKPIAITADEVAGLIRLRQETGKKIGEAFMVRTHPRWLRVRQLVRTGRIGQLRAISGYFMISLADPANIRFIREFGGGALMDLGSYQITLARMLFAAEPTRVLSLIDRHPVTGVDRLSSLLLEFPTGQANFTCAFETARAQSMTLLGTTGRIEISDPVSAPASHPSQIRIDDNEIEEIEPVNQYAVHLDAFCRAILDNTPEPVPLEDSLANMRALEAALSGSSRRPNS